MRVILSVRPSVTSSDMVKSGKAVIQPLSEKMRFLRFRVLPGSAEVYVDLYSAFYAKRLKCAQTWITQFYL